MPDRQRVEIVIPLRTMLSVLAFAGIVALALLSLDTLISVFLAAVIALGLDPIVSSLVRRGWGRGRAAFTVFLGVGVATTTLVLLAVGPFWDEVKDFVKELPAYWDNFTNSDAFTTITSTAGADDKVAQALKDLASGLPDAAAALLGVAGGIFSSVLSLVTLTFLSLFLLMERPTITDWVFGFTPPTIENRWRPVVEDSIHAISSTLLGNIAISVIAGTVAGVTSYLLGLPFPVVLGVITGFLDLIPQVGATVAAVILSIVALTVSVPATIVTIIVQLVYQQAENYIIYPIVYRRAVQLSAFTTIAAVLFFSAILGVAGAILAVPFAAVIKVVLREAGAPRRERMAALREAEVPQPS